MKTVSFSIENLCVPCSCRCRHCLLGYDGNTIGVGYEQGKSFAQRIASESPIKFSYYIGFCMDTPMLFDYITFCREIGSPGGRFLQMNGFQERPYDEIEHLMDRIKNSSVEIIDLTFYGLPDYHDAFAGRPGDFRFLTKMLTAANKAQLPVNISVPITEDNAGQIERLFDILSEYKTDGMSLYLPHSKGRGWFMEPQRLKKSTLEHLSPSMQAHMPKVKTQSEAQWLSEKVFPEPEKRHLTLSLTPDNFERYNHMSAEKIIGELEMLDDTFYGAVPSAEELARLYGNPLGDRLFRYRDLVLLWTKIYVRENNLKLHDMTDERGHFSIRQ